VKIFETILPQFLTENIEISKRRKC